MFSFIKKFFKGTLHKACEIGDIKAVRQQLVDGADVNARHWYWTSTPLHSAAHKGDKEIVELLIAYGADVNAREMRNGTTPLNSATQMGQHCRDYKEIVELLIAEGADVNAEGWNGDIPLHVAYGHKEIAELLITKGADVNAKNKNGDTPLDTTQKTYSFDSPEVKAARKETADLLRKHGGKTLKELEIKNILENKMKFLNLLSILAVLGSITLSPSQAIAADQPDPLALNFHLMHPGGDSKPADPNAAFHLDGTYHLHYILTHERTVKGKTRKGLSWIHVTSPDMLHWTWRKTKLQPSFTGHNMCSGTGFMTKDGKPAVIYHGGGSKRNQIAIAKDHQLSAWESPFPIEPKTADGEEADFKHWDPDCFRIGDTYYAYSGGREQPLMKSKDLKSWTYLGDFLKHELDDVVLGEDISCGNFFPIGNKWMLLCISHQFGCRYYLGNWDAKAEQFVPESHGRMNWRQEGQDLNALGLQSRDIFAPESVLTPDGRRVMWAWSATADESLQPKSIQSLPRELSLGADGGLRMAPLRELELQRFDLVTHENIKVVIPKPKGGTDWRNRTKRIAELKGDSYEIRITVDREEAERKRFGFRLFANENRIGLPIYFQPNNGTLRVGGTEAPFKVSDLPEGEDVELRIFIDKYFVEVFVNNRQAVVAADMNWQDASGFDAYSFAKPTTIKKVEIWKIKPTNQGYLEARENRIWEIDTE